MVITKAVVNGLYEGIRLLVKEYGGIDAVPTEKVNTWVFKNMHKSDIVPAELVTPILKVISMCYDKSGVGYDGVMKEITFRVSSYAAIFGQVKFSDFFLHTSKQKDYRANGKSMEIKTGCGNWLYGNTNDFDTIVRNYSRRKELIHWDYKFTIETKKAGKENYHILIETNWKTLFTFLQDFNGNLKTWFKENAKSGEHGTFIYEMQTIKTSKKKADYLKTFDKWLRERG